MNKDIRLSVGFLDHPKTIKLERRLGWPGIRSLIRLWLWAAENRPAGILEGLEGEDIEIVCQWRGKPGHLIATLVEMRWLDREADGFSLHNWAKHNGYVIHSPQREEKARRAAQARWGKKNDAPSICSPMLVALPDASSSNAPSPYPFPDPSPSPKERTTTLAEGDQNRLPQPEKNPIKTGKVPLSHEDYCSVCRERLPQVLNSNRDVWAKAYPAVNLNQEMAAALGWLLTHPRERKSDFPRFLNGWINRAQNRAPAKTGPGNGGLHGSGSYRRSYRPGGMDPAISEEQERINADLRAARARKSTDGDPDGPAGDDHRPGVAVPGE